MFSKEKRPMKRSITLVLVSLALLLTVNNLVHGQNMAEYSIFIDGDGSASWSIKQTGTDIQVSPDALVEFQNNLSSLTESAQHETQRDMKANVTSITSTVSGSYIAVEYRFYWGNFAKTENTSMIIGDVFQVQDLFSRLCGEGKVYITYPAEYVVDTVSPLPYAQNDSLRTLEWLGTKNLIDGSPTIILRKRPMGLLEILERHSITIAGLIALFTGSSLSIYTLRKVKKKKSKTAGTPKPSSERLLIESDEDRILKLLSSSGGTLRQSAITEQCRFSKAKTSQLLKTLENKGIVKRHKQGRDKVVTLSERSET